MTPALPHRLALPLAGLLVAAALAACTSTGGRRLGGAGIGVGRRGRVRRAPCPTTPAGSAARRRDPDGHDRDGPRPMVLKIEADLSPDRGRQLRGPRRVRVLRRRAVPPGRARVRHPGRRPDRDRDGRPGLHDQGRAGHRHLRPRHGRHGPDRRAGLGRLAVLHRPRRRRPPTPSAYVQHLPDHRIGDVRDGDGGRDRRRGQRASSSRPIPCS